MLQQQTIDKKTSAAKAQMKKFLHCGSSPFELT